MDNAYQVRWSEGTDDCSSTSWHRSEESARKKAAKLSATIGEALVGEVEHADGGAKHLVRSWTYKAGKLEGAAKDEGRRLLEVEEGPVTAEDDPKPQRVTSKNSDAESSGAETTEGNEAMPNTAKKATSAKKPAGKSAPAKKSTAANAAAGKAATRNTARAVKAAPEAKVYKNEHSQFAADVGLREGSHLWSLAEVLHKNLNKPVSVTKACAAVYGDGGKEHRGKLRLVIGGLQLNLEKGKVKGYKFAQKKEEDGEIYLTLAHK